MTSSLVGSEMCIRDRQLFPPGKLPDLTCVLRAFPKTRFRRGCVAHRSATCLLYTSDAADDM
eukprot:11629305-Prorocentrum_lima.AAC.1